MEVVRWGLIGCGDISRRRVAPALKASPNSDLVAVSRAQVELLDSFAEEFGAQRAYPQWQELVRDPEINAVYVATPVHLHAPQSIAAANAGKHVLCEKPMALNVSECDEIIDACRINNVKLGIAYYRHFYPAVRRMKEIVESGELGKPVFAQVNAFERFDPEPNHPRSWLLKPQLSGGGPMMDFGCHRIEVLLDVLGPIVETRSVNGKVLFKRDVEDTASALFRFASGAFANLTVTHAALEPQDTFDLFCSAGSIHVPVLNAGKLRVVTANGERHEELPPQPNTHQPLIDNFTMSLIEDRNPQVGGDIGRAVALVEEQIYSNE